MIVVLEGSGFPIQLSTEFGVARVLLTIAGPAAAERAFFRQAMIQFSQRRGSQLPVVQHPKQNCLKGRAP
jgi:hypothetical protein